MRLEQQTDRLRGRRIYRYETVTSTNDVAHLLAENQADEGTIVVAAEQTLGRGSRGRVWHAERGRNLLFSVLVRPHKEPNRFHELGFVAAVALAHYLDLDTKLPSKLKWPNDVLVNGKKIAGILIEVHSCQRGRPAAVIGVGLNVNWVELPVEIAGSATSLQLETGRLMNIESVLQGVLNRLDAAYAIYADAGFQKILELWKSMECSTGSLVVLQTMDGVIEGVVDAVDLDGSLLVNLQDGELRRVEAATLIVR